MDLITLLPKIISVILHDMSQKHHIILFGLIAYLIRYCTGTCYAVSGDPVTCITSPVNAALNQSIIASNTCGNPPEGYCYIGPERTCRVCDQGNPDLSHPAANMVDQFSLTNVTWWQSQTWWTSNQLGLSKMFEPLKVDITVTLEKMYLISGGVYVTFKTERPKRMIIERSSNFGVTWEPYQYYATNCRSAYNLQGDPPIDSLNPFKPICSELYSGEFPRSGGVVHFDPRTRYSPADYYNSDVHKYLKATGVRIRLEYPGTDGREYINEETTLNQYYYAINDLRIDARCDCNGHSEFCDIKNGRKVCDCQHFTEGDDCGACKPMYRNRKWLSGNLSHANPCQKCQCFDHAFDCQYSDFLNQGVCLDCIHHTRGVRCDQCQDGYYRNTSKQLNDPEVCIPCDCYEPGITDIGLCSQIETVTTKLGQCNCKIGIFGRKCDQCLPGKWGFINPPVGSCFDCSCNMFGTLNNNQTCDPYDGQCQCKGFTTGRACDTCRPGYYKFPTTLNDDCLPCPCNIGGANPSCNPNTGICTCKTGITGPICDRIQPGYFFPNFTFVKFEPEFSSANGSYTWFFLVRNYARFFTGLGFARLDAGQNINFHFTVPTTANYFMVLRYSLYHLDWYSYILPQGRELVDYTGSTDKDLYLRINDRPNQWLFTLNIRDSLMRIVKSASISIADLMLGDDKSWISSSFVALVDGEQYEFSLTYESSSLNYGIPWPLLLDSFILMLDYSWASYYTLSKNNIKTEIQSCFQSSRALATTYNLPNICGPHTLTIDTQLYDKALTCNCFQQGSMNWNTCDAYGGQCQCKPGYGGRRCDQCIPGYHGDPIIGCSLCRCSVAGSQSNACDHLTGQCLCKANAHGLKCDGCLYGYFFLNEDNPKGCQSCFGYGHLSSCKTAAGFIRSYIQTDFRGLVTFDGWRLFSSFGSDETRLLIKTANGMEYTDENSSRKYFVAPQKYLGDQLFSFGQLLVIEMVLSPVSDRLASNVEWNIRLHGNGQVAKFKFLEDISITRTRYTIRLHQDYMLNTTKLSEFNFKAMLGQLTAFHIGVVYFEAPVTITLNRVALETATFVSSFTPQSIMLQYIEDATCLKGYKGLSCESCDIGYTRVIPNGGPLINCVPCACNNRSTMCDAQSGICSNCKPGTQGSYCEKCLVNVLEPECKTCVPGYYGLFTKHGGCRACNCFLPGTAGGNNDVCDSSSGQCICNSTLNVGGRQCNNCKENSFNISLGEQLRCQECPVCYGLIENSVLQVRMDISAAQIEIITTINMLSTTHIIPFFQAITTMQSSVRNLTERADKGQITVSGLDLLWQTLEEKCNLFLTTLRGSTTIKMEQLLNEANSIFIMRNSTQFQYFNIYNILVTNYNQLNNSVRARVLQQVVALYQLNQLAKEMENYLNTANAYASTVLGKKYDLKQKIQLSINAAKQAADMAKMIREEAFNLTQRLTPVYTRALDVKTYADTCIISIEVWITNATQVYTYALGVLENIVVTIPDHTRNITGLKAITTSLLNEYRAYTAKLFTLSNNINAVALEITKLKTSLLGTQISSAGRRANLIFANILILENKTNSATQMALQVFSEATSMYNTVQNFMAVATEAQTAANKALAQVGGVQLSVEQTLQTALSISQQIQGPRSTAASALQIMTTSNQLTVDEKNLVDSVYASAIELQLQTQSAQMLVQGTQIQQYIEVSLNPLVAQCTNYRKLSETAYNSAQNALNQAQQAHSAALSTAQKIQVLATNINNLAILNTAELQDLIVSIERAQTNFNSLGLGAELGRLRLVYSTQINKINAHRAKNLQLRSMIVVYKAIYQSLITMSCQ